MKTLIAAIALASLAGCAIMQSTYAPDGRPAYALDCSGIAAGWQACYKAAGEACGARGYDVLAQSSETQAGATLGAQSNGLGGVLGGHAWSTQQRSMLIACKADAA